MPESVQQPTPQPQVASTPQSTNWKKIVLTVLIIIVVTGLIAGVYWFFILNKETDTSDLTGPVPKPKVTTSTPSATPSAKKDETTNWKTIERAGIGLLKVSFKYPPGWQTNTAGTDGDSCDAVSIAPTDGFYCGSPRFSPIYIKPLTAGDKVRCKSKTNITTINGESAIWCSETISEDTKIFFYSLSKGTKIMDYFFEGKSGPGYKGVAAWYTQEPGRQSYQKEFELLLGTLQFLECRPGEPYC